MLYLDYIDLLEILILSSAIYLMLLWLSQDQDKRLLYQFYLYCLCLYISNLFSLTIVYTVTIIATPVLVVLAFLFHQKTLQKNFVTLVDRNDYPSVNFKWLEELAKCVLLSLNRNKELVYVIECTDKLNTIIRSPSIFNADLSLDIFEILLSKHPNSPNYMIWLNKDGKLLTTQANWNLEKNSEWLSEEVSNFAKWQQNAIITSNKTDAIIFKTNIESRSFDLIVTGKQFQNINSEQLYNLIAHHIKRFNAKKTNYQLTESFSKKLSNQQQDCAER